jgi:hypothetical protein
VGYPVERWEIRVEAPSSSEDPASLKSRLAASRALLRSYFEDIAPSETLLAAWLAQQPDALDVLVDGASGEWIVACERPEHVTAGVTAISRLVMQYGMPIIAVEPERPTSVEDRRMSRELQAALASAGLRTVDGTAVRESRRTVVDEAVDRGLDGQVARETLDHLDADFIARIENRPTASRLESVYGVELHLAERTCSVTLMRAQVDSVVVSWQDITQRRSRSRGAAEQDAEANAISSVAASLLAAIASDWIALAGDTRPWIVEVLHPIRDLPSALASGGKSTVTVLEHRPGVRSVIEVRQSDVASIEELIPMGSVIRKRPGVVLLAPRSMASSITWIAGGAALSILVCSAGWFALRRRSQRRSIRPAE